MLRITAFDRNGLPNHITLAGFDIDRGGPPLRGNMIAAASQIRGSLLRSTTLAARTQTKNKKYGKSQIAVSGAAPARNSPIPITSADHPSQVGSCRVQRAAKPDATKNAATANQLTTNIPFERPDKRLAPVASRSARLNVSAKPIPNSASHRTMKMAAVNSTKVGATSGRFSATRNLAVRTAAKTVNPNKPTTPTKASAKGRFASDLA